MTGWYKPGRKIMETKYLKVDPNHPDPFIIEQAAQYIRSGELLAFPTETVYGLGADALQATAAEKIFTAKGRPVDHPLLVHVSKLAQVEKLSKHIPLAARQLMERFWPGPLSIILEAQPWIPEIVRGNQPTVGFRMPSHPVSIALINATGPIAAPSANLYGRPSPTSADHVRLDLDGRIAAVLDAGETGTGLESTLIDFSAGMKILRRGGVAVEEIEKHLGLSVDVVNTAKDNNSAYDIKVKVILSRDDEDFARHLNQCREAGEAVALVHIAGSQKSIPDIFNQYTLDLSGQGTAWFSILRDAEEKQLDTLLFEPMDIDKNRGGIADSILDRIKRAAQK